MRTGEEADLGSPFSLSRSVPYLYHAISILDDFWSVLARATSKPAGASIAWYAPKKSTAAQC